MAGAQVDPDIPLGFRLGDVFLKNGRLHGHLSVPDPALMPTVALTVDGLDVAMAELVEQSPGSYALSAAVPPQALNEGVTTIIFRESASGLVLGRYVFRSGAPVDGDVVGDLDALTAELAALKRAFMLDAADRKLRAAERPLIVEEAVSAALRELLATAQVPTRPSTGD